ncbi:PepSY domain-containing protein [Verrucomicrobium spinosum]|uniref:PepSY domain-containing protein n=1 Tax=Verrucomicrobium spinosum TaxID=2736 RepID=UPI00094644C6
MALKLHYSLLLGDWGIFFAGVLALLLCLLGLSGIYLYRGFWKTLFTLRWRSSARLFFSDLHKMVGISSVVFNLILGLTGAWWNLPVIKELVWGKDGSSQQEAEGEKDAGARPRMYNQQLSINELVQEAARLMPGLDPNRVYLSLRRGTNTCASLAPWCRATGWWGTTTARSIFMRRQGEWWR